MTPKSVALDSASRHKRLELIKERYRDVVLSQRPEMDNDVVDAFDEDDDYEPAYD